jgi:lipid II:glycine glycyltransferase (peptidoglycan interpeptide bridge formation enzyme)
MDDGPDRRTPLLLLVRRLAGGFCFAYVPHGPEPDVPESDRAAFLTVLSRELRPLLPRRCVFIRYDLPWHTLEPIPEKDPGSGPRAAGIASPLVGRPLVGRPLWRAVADVQAPDTVLIDLLPDEDAILAAMKPKWRYNVRLAEKKGVVVEQAGMEAVHEFYELYRATSMRDRIALHPEKYYARLFSLAAELRAAGVAGTPDIRLWIARFDGKALAAIVTLFRGESAVYLYGASSDENRNLMPAYALQWNAMRAAKAAGCERYDLFGIPPTDDPAHPMAGLYRFKTGFGGMLAHRAGSWDFPLRGLAYAVFRFVEKARAWWFKDLMKKLRRPGKAKS